MAKTQKSCPDCQHSLVEIRLIDKTGEYSSHARLEYTSREASRSFWSGRFPVEGKISAYMCGGCGRILLYGDGPPLPEMPELIACIECGTSIQEGQSQCPSCGWSWLTAPSDHD